MTDIQKKIYSKISKIEIHSNLQYLILFTITVLAAGLRFYKLGEWSFWIDEIFTLRDAQNLSISSIEWPRLSLILIGVTTRLFGINEINARLVPALIGTFTIPILYFPIRKLFGNSVALVTGILLAVSTWHIFWSQNARFYTSILLLYTLALFFFHQALEKDRPVYLIISLLLLGLAVIERFIALFFIPVVVFYILFLIALNFEQPKGFTVRNILLLVSPGLILCIFEIHSIITSNTSIIVSILDIFSQPNIHPLRLLTALLYRITIPVFCLGVSGGLSAVIKYQRQSLFVLIGGLAPAIFLLILATFMFTVDRYVFISLPFWLILSAIAIVEMFHFAEGVGKLLAFGVFILVIATSMGENFLYYQFQNGNRQDWRGAFAFVQSRQVEGDIILSTRPEIGSYYLSDKVEWINNYTPEGVIQSDQRIWFVIGETGLMRPDFNLWVKENSEMVDVRDIALPGKTMEMRVYLYEP